METRHKAEMIRVLDARIAARSFDGRTVLLFGHCNATEETADYLLSRGVTPVAILDNSAAKQGQAYREIPITPPEIVRNYAAENSVALIATRFFAEMSAQLRRLGYDGEIVQVVEYNSFAEYSLSDETLQRKTARMRRGAETLKNIRNQYPAQHLIICPNNALGDAYWAMAFLPAYRAKRGIDEVAIVVVGDGCRQVAEMFGTERIVTLSPTEMDEFTQAVIYTRDGNCIFAHHDRPYTDNIIKYLDKYFMSFIDYYRFAVYGLPRETEPAAPTDLQPFGSGGTLQKGHSVILAPCAKSVTQMPAVFWENLAAEWRGKGSKVCTSVYGSETPIRGTAPLTLPLNQMAAAAEYAGVFIGLRNGLCDVLHAANCRKIVVFPDCFYSTTPHKVADFFALPGWESVVC
ncbi:MAG: hypothetical protein LBG12_02225 [Synergistaceae bacterium]|jgi:hypothetical protein|nr:hypothetical protein [Synergistaceae bacterium]